jgi:hypothetical protein
LFADDAGVLSSAEPTGSADENCNPTKSSPPFKTVTFWAEFLRFAELSFSLDAFSQTVSTGIFTLI